MHKPRFSKEDLQREVRNLILLQARSLSWAYDVEASHRLLNWPIPLNVAYSPLRDIELSDFDEVARLEGQSSDLSRFDQIKVFDQLYDYGVMGLLRDDMEPLAPCTQPGFAAAWLEGVLGSSLIHESHAGHQFDHRFARATVALAQARAILDGLATEGRFYRSAGDPPGNDMLTFAEVALLGDMDERSVRNAASKKDSGLVATSVDEGRKSFIKADAARSWLKDRKGFVPTRAAGLLENFDLLSRGFTGRAEATEYLRLICERKNITLPQFATLCGVVADEAPTDWSCAPLPDDDSVQKVATKLEIDGKALLLRLQELRLVEETDAIRRALQSIRQEKNHGR